MRRDIYLDANATHPLLPSVREGLAEALKNEDPRLGNSSSIHLRGQQAKALVAQLKESLCQSLGRPDPDEFVLTSGATESINLAIKGFKDDRLSLNRKVAFIASKIEHLSVLESIEKTNAPYTFVSVNEMGEVSESELWKAAEDYLSQDCDLLFCFQVCNNETGIVLNLTSFLRKLFERWGPKVNFDLPKVKGGRHPVSPQRYWVLLDAAQALGKLNDDEIRRPLHYADYAALSAHKIGGPAGIGTLWLRPGSPFHSQITGGVQERKRRAGTLNAIGILGFQLALGDWQRNGALYRKKMRELQERLFLGLRSIPGVNIHAGRAIEESRSLPNTLNFDADSCLEESLLLSLDLEGFCLSSGSACNSGSLRPSHVLLGLGYSRQVALSSLRVSWGAETTLSEIESFLEVARAKILQIREARAKSNILFKDEVPSGRMA